MIQIRAVSRSAVIGEVFDFEIKQRRKGSFKGAAEIRVRYGKVSVFMTSTLL